LRYYSSIPSGGTEESDEISQSVKQVSGPRFEPGCPQYEVGLLAITM